MGQKNVIRIKPSGFSYVFTTFLLGTLSVAAIANEEIVRRFGAPSSVENSLADENHYERIEQWLTELQEKNNLSLGIDYYALGLSATDASEGGEDFASSGVLRFFGNWQLLNPGQANAGSVIWKLEHRHKYSDIPPKSFGIGHLGYVGLIAPAYNNEDLRLTNLFWKQAFDNGSSSMMIGFLDVTDYIDTYALASPWNGFLNFAFSTGSAAMPLPSDAALGVAYGILLDDNWYAVAGLADTNAQADDPFDGFDSFFNDNQYLYTFELGFTPSQDRIYLDNNHVTIWYSDVSEIQGNPDSSSGFTFSLSKMLNDGWMPFVRGGYADGGGSLLEQSVSLGIGKFGLWGENNQLGMAINYGKPNEETFVPDLNDQYAAELYYRYQFTPSFALTPDIQYIKDPALSSESATWVFGLRVKFNL